MGALARWKGVGGGGGGVPAACKTIQIKLFKILEYEFQNSNLINLILFS